MKLRFILFHNGQKLIIVGFILSFASNIFLKKTLLNNIGLNWLYWLINLD